MNNTMQSGLLRAALIANALFSIATGSVLLLFSSNLAPRLSLPASVLVPLGAGLVVFGFFVAFTGVRARIQSLRAVIISAMDLGWVLASLVLVVSSPWWLLPFTSTVVLAVAVVVFLLAIGQLLGVRRQLRETGPNLGDWRYCVPVDVDVPASAMWKVIADIGAIAHYMPELAHSGIRGNAAPTAGAVRACRNAQGQAWAEQCTLLDHASYRFDVTFLTEEHGFPYPMSKMFGGWQVTPRGTGSRVVVWWSLTPSVKFLPGWLVTALMGAGAERSFPPVVHRMAAAATGRPVAINSRVRTANAVC